MKYNEFFPKEARNIISLLRENGFCAYFVGGCVRDYFMGRKATDYDLTTDATSEQIISVLEGADIKTFLKGKKFGTVSACINGFEFEITPHRTEGGYVDHRHPTKVNFVKELVFDLSRRDFTINALALYSQGEDEVLEDRFGGISDIENKIIKCVGEADERFEEDALRILRAIRFSAQLGFEIEEKTALAIKRKLSLLKFVSGERKTQELKKTFENGLPFSVIKAFPEVFEEIFGKISEGPYDFSSGGFCECVFYLMRKNDIASIEKTLSHLKLSSKEKEAVLSYKKIYDTGVCMETLPYLVLKFSKYLEKYSEIFGGNGTISAFFADEDLPKNIKNMNISGSQLENLGFSGAEIRKAQEKIFCDIISRKVENKKEELEKYAERIRKEI